MRKFFICLILFASVFSTANANHTKGGWMYYEYLGPGSSANTLKYRITLKLYTHCILTPGQFDQTINFSIFSANTNLLFDNPTVTYSNESDIQNCTRSDCHPCISLIPSICYKIITYELIKDLPITTGGFIIAYQRCCRINGIVNIQSPSSSVGETWTVTIPGTSVTGAQLNSSARFAQNDTAIICSGSSFIFNFGATDVNNDSLSYSFTPAFLGGNNGGGAAPNPASDPPYTPVPYAGGYAGSSPMGSSVTINPRTGIVSGIAPAEGIYVLTVTASEYRRGTNIKVGEVRKSLHIEVTFCVLTEASLNPQYINCKDSTFQFVNNAPPDNIDTWLWDFGDGNTSTQPSPTHTYADTGTYTLKLVVNPGGACTDSATSIVKVYPGYFPRFTESTPTCKGVPVQFRDETTATYGTVNYWKWDFGITTIFNDTSRIRTPVYTYNTPGDYNVQLIVASSKGCIDTLNKTITILDRAPFTVFPKDTLICSIDTLQITAQATTGGTVTWSPNYMIDDVNSFTPRVSPDVDTTYYVRYSDSFGCSAEDSVRIRVVNEVTLQTQGDTTICKTDSIVLNVNSDALYYTWTPAAGLNNTTIKNPKASPETETTYRLVASIGKCFKESQIKITPVPYPVANAGNDKSICFGTDTFLQASGGSIYNWSPPTYLSATNIANPAVIQPRISTRYIVSVQDVLGCPKPVFDTMLLTVVRVIANAGPRDTSVVLGQPLQLNATGSDIYSWAPSTWLSNPNIPNPISLPQDDIEYVVRVSNGDGCFGTDSIRVKLYKLAPSLYVPSAFSPDGDGLNEIFRPIAIGIKSLKLFRVYNRWGQMVYSTSQINAGWDGKFKGQLQAAGTFVWHAEAVDYLGKEIRLKGSVILIR